MRQHLPRVAVPRFSTYLRCLDELGPGIEHISSDRLASLAGVSPAQLRKDLSYFGSYGVRGVGYRAGVLRDEIRRELGLTREWPWVLVGVGNLGRALAHYAGFAEQGFRLVGIFDIDPDKVGTMVAGQRVEPLESLARAVRARAARIAVIATPAEAAQGVANLLAESGIASILNFAPTILHVPDAVNVRRVDVSSELQVLAFFLHEAAVPAP